MKCWNFSTCHRPGIILLASTKWSVRGPNPQKAPKRPFRQKSDALYAPPRPFYLSSAVLPLPEYRTRHGGGKASGGVRGLVESDPLLVPSPAFRRAGFPLKLGDEKRPDLRRKLWRHDFSGDTLPGRFWGWWGGEFITPPPPTVPKDRPRRASKSSRKRDEFFRNRPVCYLSLLASLGGRFKKARRDSFRDAFSAVPWCFSGVFEARNGTVLFPVEKTARIFRG